MPRFRLPWQQPPVRADETNTRGPDTWRKTIPPGISYGSIPTEDSGMQFAETWWCDYVQITCVICGWRIGTCGFESELDERRISHARLCRMPDSKPEPCGQPSCIKCQP